MSILFVGRANLGGAQMRGRDVAARMGERFCDWKELPSGPLDTVVVVKYYTPQIKELRKRCRLLIADPLDCFSQMDHPQAEPRAFWRRVREETQCDIMFATSPACADTMEGCGCRVVIAPHHADERVGTDWYDPNGPVVYAGGERFLGGERPRIEAACKELGRGFVCRSDKECWQALNGASLSLCVRFGRERTPLSLNAKPTVKIANAARAGIPVLATIDPCLTDMAPLVMTDGSWTRDLPLALRAPSPRYPWTLDTHCDLLRSLA